MTTPTTYTDLCAQGEEVRKFLSGAGELKGRTFGDDLPGPRFWWRKHLDVIDALIAAIRELEARVKRRDALLQSQGRELELRTIRAEAAEATVATLTEKVEAMRGALLANLTFAEKIAEAADIDPKETALNVRVMPEGREVARRTWAEVIAQGRAALTTEKTNG